MTDEVVILEDEVSAEGETSSGTLASADDLLEKPFDDYTVTEGLLLLILLVLIAQVFIKLIKGAFKWLNW